MFRVEGVQPAGCPHQTAPNGIDSRATAVAERSSKRLHVGFIGGILNLDNRITVKT